MIVIIISEIFISAFVAFMGELIRVKESPALFGWSIAMYVIAAIFFIVAIVTMIVGISRSRRRRRRKEIHDELVKLSYNGKLNFDVNGGAKKSCSSPKRTPKRQVTKAPAAKRKGGKR